MRTQARESYLLFPKNSNWKRNTRWLALNLRRSPPGGMICRGPVATAIALRARLAAGLHFPVCYDGRGARAAEIEEYSPTDPLAPEMPQIESEAVNGSDWRIAVSNALVAYWQERYAYMANRHTVIPCSLSLHFSGIDDSHRHSLRQRFNWAMNDPVIAFAGGGAEWQNSKLSNVALRYWLRSNSKLRLLGLTKGSPFYDSLSREFPGQIQVTTVPHAEMPKYLSTADYGLLMREESTTNRVAAPVKFAEYLSCGLKVLCSRHVGDFSDIISKTGTGAIVTQVTVHGPVCEPLGLRSGCLRR